MFISEDRIVSEEIVENLEKEKIMRRLNERNEDYHESLNRVKTKCIKSNFNQKLFENQFLEFQKNKEIANKPSEEKTKKKSTDLHSSRNY